MEPEWARYLRDQCRDTGAARFLKQMWKRQPIPADLMVPANSNGSAGQADAGLPDAPPVFGI